MEKLVKTLNEALSVNESVANYDDMLKADKSFATPKLKAYIKKHEKDIVGDENHLGSGDIKDIVGIMQSIHAYVASAFDNDENEDLKDWFHDGLIDWVKDDYGDGDDWIDDAKRLYLQLFKEASHKDLF